MSSSLHDLPQIQSWMQAVIMHPDGVHAGIKSEVAQQQIQVQPEHLETVINRSRRQTSMERLQIYATAYYARLLECLREEFPALTHALGEETFNSFAFAYLQAYPSKSYTLANLARQFPQFLAETRPADAEREDGIPNWPDFLIELAIVERTYSEVFDGPGIEDRPVLQAGDLAAILPEQWPDARLVLVPCLRLLVLRFPAHEYISAVRHQTEATLPAPSPTYLVVTRREFVVRRCAVSRPEFELLTKLGAGETVGSAIKSLARDPGIDLHRLEADLRQWFAAWASAGYFQAFEWPQ